MSCETEPRSRPLGPRTSEKDGASASSFSDLLASMRGFEPPTYRLGGGRSILLSYMDIYSNVVIITSLNLGYTDKPSDLPL